MADREKLMFRREHFPVEMRPAKKIMGRYSYDFKPVEIPPYHPSMAREGIDPDLALLTLDEALDGTFTDMEDFREKRPDIGAMLYLIQPDNKKRHGNAIKRESGIMIESFPITGKLYIKREIISPSGIRGHSIEIKKGSRNSYLNIPESVHFPSELMKEYGMKEAESLMPGSKRIGCPYCWHINNLFSTERIFYKNLVIAMDNAIIKKKYPG